MITLGYGNAVLLLRLFPISGELTPVRIFFSCLSFDRPSARPTDRVQKVTSLMESDGGRRRRVIRGFSVFSASRHFPDFGFTAVASGYVRRLDQPLGRSVGLAGWLNVQTREPTEPLPRCRKSIGPLIQTKYPCASNEIKTC